MRQDASRLLEPITRTVTGSSPVGGAKAQVRGLANDQRRLLMGRAPHKRPTAAPTATVDGAVALMLAGMVLVGALTVAAVEESR